MRTVNQSRTTVVFAAALLAGIHILAGKEITTITTENYTRQEFDYFISISNNYRFGKEETDFIYNLYNRVFKEKKQPGCGKCFTNVIKSLKKKYDGLYTQ